MKRRRKNSDVRAREAERYGDRAADLAWRVRRGELDPIRLRWAAELGDPDALSVLGGLTEEGTPIKRLLVASSEGGDPGWLLTEEGAYLLRRAEYIAGKEWKSFVLPFVADAIERKILDYENQFEAGDKRGNLIRQGIAFLRRAPGTRPHRKLNSALARARNHLLELLRAHNQRRSYRKRRRKGERRAPSDRALLVLEALQVALNVSGHHGWATGQEVEEEGWPRRLWTRRTRSSVGYSINQALWHMGGAKPVAGEWQQRRLAQYILGEVPLPAPSQNPPWTPEEPPWEPEEPLTSWRDESEQEEQEAVDPRRIAQNFVAVNIYIAGWKSPDHELLPVLQSALYRVRQYQDRHKTEGEAEDLHLIGSQLYVAVRHATNGSFEQARHFAREAFSFLPWLRGSQ